MVKKGIILIICITAFMATISCKKEQKTGPIITGGWTKIDINSIDTLNAFSFLKDEMKKSHNSIKLLKVTHAKKQIVAGTNYMLTCTYQKGTEGNTRKLDAKINRSLSGKYSLLKMDIESLKCKK